MSPELLIAILGFCLIVILLLVAMLILSRVYIAGMKAALREYRSREWSQ